MHRLLLKSTLIAFAIAAVSLQPASIHAQAGDHAAAGEPDMLDLDFSGGTALGYVDAIRAAQPSANIVVLGDLARIKMAGVKLRGVDVSSALRVLNQLPSEQGDIVCEISLENVAMVAGAPEVFTVTAEIRNRGPAPGYMQSAVISMADLLGDNLKSADALSAISASLALIEASGEPAQLKFHEETGLLIARGSPEQMETVREVITQLRERQGTLDVREQTAASRNMQREQMEVAARQDSKAQAEANALTREVTQWRTKAELLEQTLDETRRQMLEQREQMMRTIAELQTKLQERQP